MKSHSSIAGWIFGKRTIQHKRRKTTEFNTGMSDLCSKLGKWKKLQMS